MTTMNNNAWYPERDRDATTDYEWQPVLFSLEDAHVIVSLPVWFRTSAECVEFITTEVIGAVLDPDVEQADDR